MGRTLALALVWMLVAAPAVAQSRPLSEIAADLERLVAELRGTAPTPTPPPGAIVKVKAGGNIQLAVRSLLPTGGVVELAPGNYAGPLVLPARPATAPIIMIRPSSVLPD